MSSSSPQRTKLKKQQEAMNNYMTDSYIKELFRGLLKQVIIEQPHNPYDYMYDEISKIKREMDDNQIDMKSTTFLTTQFPPPTN